MPNMVLLTWLLKAAPQAPPQRNLLATEPRKFARQYLPVAAGNGKKDVSSVGSTQISQWER